MGELLVPEGAVAEPALVGAEVVGDVGVGFVAPDDAAGVVDEVVAPFGGTVTGTVV